MLFVQPNKEWSVQEIAHVQRQSIASAGRLPWHADVFLAGLCAEWLSHTIFPIWYGLSSVTMRAFLVSIMLSGVLTAARAQPATKAETWTPTGRTAAITGRVSFTPHQVTFQDGKSLSLTGGGQMLFRPEAKKKKVMADLYRVTPPDDPALEGGSNLCKGKTVTYLLVWKSGKVANETDPRTIAPFSGSKLAPGSPDDCGRYTYDAGKP